VTVRARAAAALAVVVLAAAGCGGGESHPRAARPRTPPAPATGAPAPVPPPVPRVRRGQTLVAAVERRSSLRAAPGGRILGTVGPRTEFGSPQVLAVLGVAGRWAHVLHPRLPDHRGGWVALSALHLRPAAWRIVVDLSARRAKLLYNGRVFHEFTVGIGSPATPTPTGTFGVTDRLSAGSGASYYGCCVIALSGHQPHVPQHWAGGDRLAIHGTDAPSTIGEAATLGCLHADEATMRLLVSRVPLGTKVVIHS
jgi:lipoprotein-anchoring transpeptidase ErfK/SrfK